MIRSSLFCALCFTPFSVARGRFFYRDPDVSQAMSCRPNEDQCFDNWYGSINVGGQIASLVAPNNTNSNDFTSGLAAITQLVDDAFDNGLRIRAYGSKWSLSNVLYTDDVMMSSQGLTYIKVGLDNSSYVTDEYQNARSRLAIVQSGVKIKDVHQALQEKSLALPTSTAAGGERLVGAISTGAHGSALHYGAMQESVRAIHIVIPGKHVLIQRATDQVITEAFGEWLGGALVINDDKIFNAALVSFGSFGIIHAVIIEAEPLFGLKFQSKQFDYDEIKPVLESLDPSSLGFDGIGSELPFHFEVSFNPYKRDKNGCFVRLHQKVVLSHEELRVQQESGMLDTFQPKETDLFEGVGQAFQPSVGLLPTDWLKKRVYGRGLQFILGGVYRTKSSEDQGKTRTPYEWFVSDIADEPSSSSPFAGTSVEIGVPVDRVVDAIELIFDVVDDYPLAAPVAIRLVKKSNATLAFTKYDLTATIELPGPCDRYLFRSMLKTHRKIFEALAASGIPHTYHWGQHFPINDEWVSNAFGADLDEWKQARSAFLGNAIDTFYSDLLEDIGLYP